MMTKQNDAATMTEGQLDAVVGGIILNNDGGPWGPVSTDRPA